MSGPIVVAVDRSSNSIDAAEWVALCSRDLPTVRPVNSRSGIAYATDTRQTTVVPPCSATTPNVAVLDVRLPDGDGIEVCRNIRSSQADVACLTREDREELRLEPARQARDEPTDGGRGVCGPSRRAPESRRPLSALVSSVS